jgi:hypothetical protein
LADYVLTESGTYRIPPRTGLGAAQLTFYLNKTNVPWHLLGTDSRYFLRAIGNKDVSNIPISGLCQYDDTLTWRHIREFGPAPNTDEIVETFDIEYSALETVNNYGEKLPKNLDREQSQMIVFANWLDFKSSDYKKNFRYRMLKKWVVDTRMDCVIYGQWSDKCYEDNTEFAGNLDHNQMNDLLDTMRCTFVLPQKLGWVTWKIWEMIGKGVIPFLHPSYDNQYHTVPKDHFIRVKNEADLIQKYEQVIHDENLYKSVINDLFSRLDFNCSKLLVKINEHHVKNKIETLEM